MGGRPGRAGRERARVAQPRRSHLHRVAAADPTVREVRRDAGARRAGRLRPRRGGRRGPLDRGASSRPAARAARRGASAALRPQERLAALLGGRDAALACEELVLRARVDLDGGRLPRGRAAAARRARGGDRRARGRGATAATWRPGSRSSRRTAARSATRRTRRCEGGLDETTIDAVYDALDRIEAALRARVATARSSCGQRVTDALRTACSAGVDCARRRAGPRLTAASGSAPGCHRVLAIGDRPTVGSAAPAARSSQPSRSRAGRASRRSRPAPPDDAVAAAVGRPMTRSGTGARRHAVAPGPPMSLVAAGIAPPPSCRCRPRR